MKMRFLFGSSLLAIPTLSGAVLFSDNFDRADNRNIGSDYLHGFIDPNNDEPNFSDPDGESSNGGGARIAGNQLQLATGTGTSNAFVNRNFTDASILAGGGFSVTLDILGSTQDTNRQGGAFAVGMALAEAAASADGSNGNDPAMQGAFTAGSTIGATVPGNVNSDFWVALRADNSLVWGGSDGQIAGLDVGSKSGEVSVEFGVPDFNAGSSVDYEVSFDGVSQGSGSFQWSDTDANYIGLDARDSTAVTFDNLTIESVPEPTSALLLGLGALGTLRRRRQA